MGHKTIKTLMILFALCWLSACGGGGAENTLQVPAASAVVRVQASDNAGGSSALSATAEIAKAVEELNRLGANWEPTKEAMPPYDYAISLVNEAKRPALVYWIGEDWIGANDMQGKPNFRQSLSAEDRQRLIDSVGF